MKKANEAEWTLFNAIAKLPMLAHRTVMFRLLAFQGGATEAASLSSVAAALNEYEEIAGQLRASATDSAFPAPLRAAMTAAGEPKDDMAACQRFLQMAAEVDAAPEEERIGRLAVLADFVSSALLESVERIQGRLLAFINSDTVERDSATQVNHKALHGAVDEIERISLSVRLIALNAAVEASRAGTAGVGFGVIASEIKSLSESAAQAADEARRQIRAL